MSRYIDADRLIDDIRPFAEYDSNRRNKDWVRRFEIAIDNVPTADVRENVQLDVCPLYGGACGYPSGECYDCPRHGNFRENVRGEWILHIDDLFPAESTMECNQCHKHQPITIDDNYCPNCGAQMIRGES